MSATASRSAELLEQIAATLKVPVETFSAPPSAPKTSATLTPHRQVLTAALDAARRDLPTRDPGDVAAMTLHMGIDAQEAILLGVADMLDHGVAGGEIREAIAAALGNAVMSHAMSFMAGDRTAAAAEATALMIGISTFLRDAFGRADLDRFVTRSAAPVRMGQA
ncbi:hypothetical protein MKL09_02930 [Methylobacterium sp. J-048]|uniref:hypothetical protein n=1 Tax=Methylobacterium sp. J-048 TaxID=2836635 RepID=UPI001FBB4187|nr:hypothetical protein [Methylobacterium sp. J-048]MCJ2055502.1 hypothetical protein [Methylobacterium sp. J-048]